MPRTENDGVMLEVVCAHCRNGKLSLLRGSFYIPSAYRRLYYEKITSVRLTVHQNFRLFFMMLKYLRARKDAFAVLEDLSSSLDTVISGNRRIKQK